MNAIDRNGEEVTLLTAVVVAVAISAVSYTASVAFSEGGFRNWDWGQFALNVGVGAASGAFSFGIGSAVASAGISNATAALLVQSVAHAYAQGILSGVQGGDFATGALSGFAGSMVGGMVLKKVQHSKSWIKVSATVGSAATVSGVTAELTGGEFWKGFAVGAIVASANHLAHEVAQDVRIAALKNRLQRIASEGALAPKTLEEVKAFYVKNFGWSKGLGQIDIGAPDGSEVINSLIDGKALARTVPGKDYTSDIYVSPLLTYATEKWLFAILGHETVHVYDNLRFGYDTTGASEYNAWSWSRQWAEDNGDAKALIDADDKLLLLKPHRNPAYNYLEYGLPTVPK